jgi:DEAD/DEAH box helicase domain-containing protein
MRKGIMNSLERFLEEVEHSRDYEGQIIHTEVIPAREAQYGTSKEPLEPMVEQALRAQGIENLYSHQVTAINAIREGKHVVVVTSTASGKTLCYNIPILEEVTRDPGARVLYLYPTKALAQDQLKKLVRYREINPMFLYESGTYDGDTPTSTRKKLRDSGNLILSNPDMLHSGILPNHTRWSDFFANLRFVVVDEIHAYRGIFGSNVANVLRRLNRICAHYGASPQFICCSATIGNPKELAEKITGHEMLLVDNDGSPRGPKRFVLWNPPFIDEGKTERKSPNAEARHLMVDLIRGGRDGTGGVQTITFVRARVLAEVLYRYCQEDLRRVSPRLANSIRAYRGGYLPENRREIEQKLFSGELMGVVSTNALELGIDIGSLDACIIVGYPGTVASTWQQAGRAGRGSDEALAILIAYNNPIDQYLMKHPEYIFGQSAESVVIDPRNPYIMVGHLRCAANELPMNIEDEKMFGELAPALLEILQENEQVRLMGNEWHWVGTGYPAADFGLRDMAENNYTIVDTTEDENKVIGMLDEYSAFMTLHDQAMYMHEAETYFVQELNLDQKIAYVEKVDPDYYTQAVTETNIRVDETEVEKNLMQSSAYFGMVTVTSTTIMFRKIKFYSLDSIGFGNLDLPPQELNTSALWITPPPSALKRVRDYGRIPSEGMMGIGNALTGVIPLYVICDYTDIGPVVDSSNMGTPTIFVYDKYQGGLGFAEKSYEMLDEIMERCLELIGECSCEDGCPSCVGSPSRSWSYFDADSESRERIPDKEAALIILHEMLGKEPYEPKPLPAERKQIEAPPRDLKDIKRLPENVEAKIRKRILKFKERR